MARLNLICNGMMLFNEVDPQHVQIVIPDITGHVRKFCGDPKPAQDKLVDLPIGGYQLQGPTATAGALRTLISPDRYLIVRKDTVTFDQAAAAAVSAIVTVPMPPLVRLFRASEPTASVFGNTPVTAAFARPRIHHDIVVFSYVNLPAGINLTIQPQAGPPLATTTPAAGDIVNWVLYSTEKAPLIGGAPPHVTALNDLLILNAAHTDFSLSGIGLKDGLHSTGIGMSAHHMAAFHELPPTALGSVIGLDSGDLGCSGVAVG